MATLEINGKRVEVDESFRDLSPEEQQRTVEEIAGQIGQPRDRNDGFLGQVNRSIAGAVDAVNPFDAPAWKDVLGGYMYTGPAGDMFRSAGIATADRPPETIVEGLGSGLGNAAAYAVPFAKGAQAMRGAGGVVGSVADDAFTGLSSLGGMTTEMLAGAVGGGSRQVAADAGAPEWAQNAVEVAAPAVGLPAAIAAGRGIGRGAHSVAKNMPVTGPITRAAGSALRGIAPMTNAGARSIAREELLNLTGGNQRAVEAAESIPQENPLGLTPAQQSGDPRLLGLERAARQENPDLDKRLADRAAESRRVAQEEIAQPGDMADTRAFFDSRLRDFRKSMRESVLKARQGSDEAIGRVEPGQTETAASTSVVERLRGELDNWRAQERDLWGQVPDDVSVPTADIKSAAKGYMDSVSKYQSADIPPVLRQLTGNEVGDAETVSELGGLYSELRRISRVARSGDTQNRNMARIADGVADAILKEFDAVDLATPEGAAIAEARAFSRSLNETFRQGAVGKVLRLTKQSDEAITPGAALKATVGKAGAQGAADASKITTAAPAAREDIADYLRGQFSKALVSADGTFSARAGATWLRNNRELMAQNPELARQFGTALRGGVGAERFIAKAEAASKLTNKTIAAKVAGDRNGVQTIISAVNPGRAAANVVATARKDQTGKALEGLQAGFADFLIGKANSPEGLSGTKLKTLISDPQMAAALQKVFPPGKFQRFRKVASELAKMDAPVEDIGGVLNNEANQIIEVIARVAAAKAATRMSGGGNAGVDLQTAQIASSRAKRFLKNLTNEKARQILVASVEDADLMRALLSQDMGSDRVMKSLAPYLAAGAAQMGEE